MGIGVRVRVRIVVSGVGHVIYLGITYIVYKNNYNKVVLVVVRSVRVRVSEGFRVRVELEYIYINRGVRLYHFLRFRLGLRLGLGD